PEERSWQAIENHPQLAEVAADIAPPPARPYDDETRLDMTALIDVTLVLLIFFILLLSYTALQKALEAGKQNEGPVKMTNEQVEQKMILVKARPGPDGRSIIQIGDETVDVKDLRRKLSSLVRDTHKTVLLIDATGVPERTVVAIEDAAAGTGITERRYVKQR